MPFSTLPAVCARLDCIIPEIDWPSDWAALALSPADVAGRPVDAPAAVSGEAAPTPTGAPSVTSTMATTSRPDTM
jgi:hypothetical protein